MQEPQENEQGEPPVVPAKTLGKYQLVARLGQGGMATVYLALAAGPAGFHKLMVLKVLREDGPSEHAELRRMFAEEARLSARFLHRNVVHTYEVSELDGHYVLAMEYLEGQTYRRAHARATRSGGLPLAEHLRILAETAHGLHYVHTLTELDGSPLHAVHCDVSPQNVFVGYDGQVKLLDFGIARTHESQHRRQLEGFQGKLDYAAPEQLQGEPVDARSDVFAVGVMLWEAISGARFGGGRGVDSRDKAQARLAGTEPSIRSVQPDVPEVLAEIVERATALEPARRFADASALAAALEDAIDVLGARPSARSLARIVSPLFARERAELRSLIEQHAQRSRAHASLPPVQLAALDLTRSATVTLGVPALAPEATPGALEQTASTVSCSLQLPSVLVSEGPEPALALSTQPQPAARKRAPRAGWLLSLGALTGALLGLLDGHAHLPFRNAQATAALPLVMEAGLSPGPTAAHEEVSPVPLPSAASERASKTALPQRGGVLPRQAAPRAARSEQPLARERVAARTAGAAKKKSKAGLAAIAKQTARGSLKGARGAHVELKAPAPLPSAPSAAPSQFERNPYVRN